MDKTIRAEVLRQRLIAVRGYKLPAYPKAQVIPKRPRKLFHNWVHWSVGQHRSDVPLAWVKEPMKKPKRERTIGNAAALLRIAEKLKR
jgi:hypothetical protein